MSEGILLQQVSAAIAATTTNIYLLHSQPDIRAIEVVYYDPLQPFGRYVPGDGRIGRIEISLFGSHPHLTFAHEVGHLLDQAAMRYTGYASAAPYSVLHEVMSAIGQSVAYSQLRAIKNAPVISFADELARRRADYWLAPQELWARAYAQYVAARSGDAILQDDVKRARILETHAASPYVQWQDEDFTVIAQAIDAAFETLRWRMIQEHDDVQTLIEQNLQSFVGKGIARKLGDVEACLRYRNALSIMDQQIFDDLLRAGTFAGSAADMVEMLAGREQPQGSAQTPVGAGVF